MSPVDRLGRSLARLPTVLRTLRPLRPAQAMAQLSHALRGLPEPTRLDDPPPQLAVDRPHAPFLDPPDHVRARDPRHVELIATPFELGDEVDWTSTRHGPLFAYHLHQHEYLRRPAFSPSDRVGRIRDWIARHPRGLGWDPHPVSLRILCWGKLLLTPGALDLDADARKEILGSLADQTETLRRGLEVRLQANHLLSNRLAVVFAGLLLDGNRSAAWRAGAAGLRREIDAQVHADGGHEERSPMYHALLLEQLLDLLNLALAVPDRAPEGLVATLRAAAGRMLVALDVFTHVDGRIALFADSAFGIAAEPAALRAYADRLGVARGAPGTPDAPVAGGARQLPQTGYVRLRRGDVDLLCSVAGPAPAHQPGHAHCDALAIELCLAGARVVSDTGVFEYVPGRRRARARSTAAHATVQIDDAEQAEIWAAHRVGGRPTVELLEEDDEGRVQARCRGWSTPQWHLRTLAVGDTGVRVVDRIEGPPCRVRATWPIAPGWTLERLESPEGERTAWRAILHPTDRDGPALVGGDAAASGARVEIRLPEALRWRVETGPYYPTFGVEMERPILVGEGRGPLRVETRFELRRASRPDEAPGRAD